jgi:hypothetical protein
VGWNIGNGRGKIFYGVERVISKLFPCGPKIGLGVDAWVGQVRHGNSEGNSREVDVDRKVASKFDPICSAVILNLQHVYKLFARYLSLNFVVFI